MCPTLVCMRMVLPGNTPDYTDRKGGPASVVPHHADPGRILISRPRIVHCHAHVKDGNKLQKDENLNIKECRDKLQTQLDHEKGTVAVGYGSTCRPNARVC